ncbi:unnamed protein product, partial [Strongylus vulgaris]
GNPCDKDCGSWVAQRCADRLHKPIYSLIHNVQYRQYLGDGDVYVWGWNHRGQLGDEKEKVELYPLPLDIDLRVVKIELKEHLTALWVPEDGDEPSIVMGSEEVGMPPFRLRYYNQEPDKKTEEMLASDAQVDMVFINKGEEKASQEGYGEFEYPVRD